MKNFLLSVIGIFLISLSAIFFFMAIYENNVKNEKQTHWEFRAIDTMKYSRDVAREKLGDKSFDLIIDRQVKQIADTGASHIAIATPYDEEFLPFLQRWVDAARKNNLKVWYRGNWSGWEGWFDYERIDRDQHIQKTQDFILKNPALFKDGDVFSACPECENGGPGDPRRTGDVVAYRQFLINEYLVTKTAFQEIGKNVVSNYNSMNGDVARLIMDKPTTKALDGIVVIDHYVASIEQMKNDIKQIAERSGGKIVLGEFGAPIPDINGEMTEDEQATWLKEILALFAESEEVVGVSYWTNTGSSTELWDNKGNPRKAVAELTKAYTPFIVETQ